MKAILTEGFGDEGVLRIVDRPQPDLIAGGVRIAATAAGLNRADLLQRRGLYPPPPGASDVLGLECGGTVAELAPGVDDLTVGERVMALVAGGGQAESVIAPRGSVMAVPSHFDDLEAGGFPEVFLTAHLNLFELGGLSPDATALVHGGSGGVGTAAIQLIKETGAQVLVTAGSAERCRRCLDLGADVAVDYRADDFVDAAMQLTRGCGVDLVLDCIGAPYLDRHLDVLALDGRLLVIGLMGGAKAELDMRRLLSRRIRIIGSTLRALSPNRKAELVRSFLTRFGDRLAAGRLRPIIDSVFSIAAVADAHRRLGSGEAFGKVVLDIASTR